MLQIKLMSTSCEIVLKWKPQNTFNARPTLVQLIIGAIKQQAITWANGELRCQNMVSLGHNELIWYKWQSILLGILP